MDLNYKVEGNGETLVFIHGLSDDLNYWEFLAANLKDDYRVVRFDLQGHGQSEMSEDEITMDNYVDDLKNLLDGLNIKKANLIGFSLGGSIAMDFTINYPDYVDSLVLMSSFSKCDDYLKSILNEFRISLEHGFEDFFDCILPKVLCLDVIESNKNELKILKELASKTANTQAYINAVDICLSFNIEDELHRINVPTMVLAGKYDEISRLDTQEELQNKIENSKLIVFDDVKHNLLVGKNNVEILNLLKKFIKNNKK